ncbi:postacrosomal sheath WW domain-binding protein isoform X2 [Erinaceus europaeus]|uniref:Postacrosomal sheath WW domain-binding protein isoform X2 n=1 Tax=Erinaceus europaeus TaxID=9365 RepID=A0ABM3X888_ERIEU|nr:postacrosomal sheath WW domain-binding protein isoform X2 [Erinaceus europaeus]
MAVNQSHTENRRGVSIPYGESVLKQSEDVELSFPQQPEGSQFFRGTKRGALFLTSYRVIFVTSHSISDPMLSFMMPFDRISNCTIEQPVFGANYILGTIQAVPDAARGAPLRSLNCWLGPLGLYVICPQPVPYGAYPTYGAPPPGYGAPPPGYGAPPPGYGAPPPGYGAPPPGYGAPPPGYGAPPPGYGAPLPGYGAPYVEHGASHSGQGSSHSGHGAPQAGTEAPLSYAAQLVGNEASAPEEETPRTGSIAGNHRPAAEEATTLSTSSSYAQSPPTLK